MLTDLEYCEKLSEFLNINYPLEKASYLVSIGFCEKNLYFINIISYEEQTNRILQPKTAKTIKAIAPMPIFIPFFIQKTSLPSL